MPSHRPVIANPMGGGPATPFPEVIRDRSRQGGGGGGKEDRSGCEDRSRKSTDSRWNGEWNRQFAPPSGSSRILIAPIRDRTIQPGKLPGKSRQVHGNNVPLGDVDEELCLSGLGACATGVGFGNEIAPEGPYFARSTRLAYVWIYPEFQPRASSRRDGSLESFSSGAWGPLVGVAVVGVHERRISTHESLPGPDPIAADAKPVVRARR